MNLSDLVKSNRQIIQFVNDWPGKDQPFHIKKNLELTKYIGTLDIATSRFNTILLRLSEHPIMKEQFANDVAKCNLIIKKFFVNTIRLKTWPKAIKPFIRWRLHRIGTKQIPKIKLTLKNVIDTVDGTH
tara:strand:- start:77 stop:463 length:387 start_codon:yes stop_codon:yes gene_type:complete